MIHVIVTDASRGLGLAITTRLVDIGYRVIAVSRRCSDELTSAANRAAEAGVAAIEFRAFDLENISGLAEFVHGLRTEFGDIYGLVNNAGIGTGGVLSNIRLNDIEQLIRLNTTAPNAMTKYVTRSMMTARTVRIVNVSSIVALTGYSGLSVYSATKASLLGFTRSIAREVGLLGIIVNAIAPGFIDTEMTQELDEAQRTKIMQRRALKRMATPIDVARSVEYLLGDGGRNTTGTVVTADAGNIA